MSRLAALVLVAWVGLALLPMAAAWAQADDDEVTEDDAGTSDDDAGDDDAGDDDTGDDDAGGFRIDDSDLGNIGADVTFTDKDLTAGDSSEAAPAKNVARLNTKALAFGRMGVDLVHDETLTGADGITEGREDTFAFRLHGRAEGTGRFGRRVKVKVGGRFDAEVSFDQETEFGIQRYEGRIWETYADFYGGRADLRFGNQIIAWGYSDLLSPNDVINARDLRRGPVVPMDELRIPVLAAKTTAYVGPLSLQAVWVPVAPSNQFELIDGDFAVLGPNATAAGERRLGSVLKSLQDDPNLSAPLAPFFAIGDSREGGVESGELGASAILRTSRIDLASYFFWGHERAPRIRVAPELVQLFRDTDPSLLTPDLIGMQLINFSAMGIVPVQVDYPRRLHFGGAASVRADPFGFKLEAAYSPEVSTIVFPEGGGVLLGAAQPLPRMTVAGGFDWSRGTELNVIVEASYARALDVDPGLEVFGMDGDKLVTVASRWAWTPGRGVVSVRFLGFLDVTSPSYALKPAIRLSGNDHLTIELAVGVYGGPRNSLGGALGRNDEVLLTLQYGL